MDNSLPPPDHTPPAHTRRATIEELPAQFETFLQRQEALERKVGEDYAVIRRVEGRVDTNHLVTMDALGQIAAKMGFRIIILEPIPK